MIASGYRIRIESNDATNATNESTEVEDTQVNTGTETTIRLALRLDDEGLRSQLALVEGRASRATDPDAVRELRVVSQAYRDELTRRGQS